MTMTIRIKNLRVKTIVGVQEWERSQQQEVVLNLAIDFDAAAAASSDDLADTLDYKALKRRIIEHVEQSRCQLLERLAQEVLGIVMSDPKTVAAQVEIDKPHALRFADSVSVTARATRSK
jgi:D-erythro-7,8-dihydroneopterin triphosphate epimerase